MRTRTVIASIAVLLAAVRCAPRETSINIATTTSLEGSGLLQELRLQFEAKSGILLNASVVGSGRALRMAADGTTDVTITHDPDAERQFVRTHKPELYRQFMWNEFVIVGPPSDPAGIRGATSAADALRRIAAAKSRFMSRHDQSGTHAKELALWRAAGVDPNSNAGYMKMGQPMAYLLRSANELDAYALTDRATFDQLQPALRLTIAFSGDSALRNVYAVTLMRRPDSEEHRNARAFVEWLLSADGRRVIESYRIRGRQQFFFTLF